MKDPCFAFYYKDFDIDTADWRGDAIGWYMRLLCYQASNNSLPSDMESIEQIARLRRDEYDVFSERWDKYISAKFKKDDDGSLYNIKLRKVINQRAKYAIKSRKKSIMAIYANYIRHHCPSEALINVKANFNHDDFMHLTNETERKEAIISHLSGLVNEVIRLSDKKVMQPLSISPFEDKQKVIDELHINFKSFYDKYPATKRNWQTEFRELRMTHNDWEEVIPQLMQSLNDQIKVRALMLKKQQFVPQWRRMSSYLRDRMWEEKLKEQIESNTKNIRVGHLGKDHSQNEYGWKSKTS